MITRVYDPLQVFGAVIFLCSIVMLCWLDYLRDKYH